MGKSLLVLAAGMGSRYGGVKQIDQLGPGGETIIDYSIYDAIHAGFDKIVFVIRKSIEQDFKEVIIDKYKNIINVDYVFQELNALPAGFTAPEERAKPWGTAHAILMAKDKIDDYFAVINGDDFYGKQSFALLSDYLNTLSLEDMHACSMVAYPLKNTLSENGTVSRGVCTVDSNHNLAGVVEHTKIEKLENTIINRNEDGTTVQLDANTPVSMNFWGFNPAIFNHIEELFIDFLKQNIENNKSEFYIPFVVDELIRKNKIQVKVLQTEASWYGITYKEDRPFVAEKFKEMLEANIYPSILWK